MNWNYIAGFFDGEGCLSIHNRRGKRGGGIQYQLSLTQTDRKVLDQIQKFINAGKVYESDSKGNKKWKPCWLKAYALRISKRKDILSFLDNIEDKIIVKKEEMQNKKKILLDLDKKRNKKIEQIKADLQTCKEMRENNKTWKEVGLVIDRKADSARCFVKENKNKDIYKNIFGE